MADYYLLFDYNDSNKKFIVNTFGTAFITSINHFYLKDNETDGTDQMLLTQLSIISSYQHYGIYLQQH